MVMITASKNANVKMIMIAVDKPANPCVTVTWASVCPAQNTVSVRLKA